MKHRGAALSCYQRICMVYRARSRSLEQDGGRRYQQLPQVRRYIETFRPIGNIADKRASNGTDLLGRSPALGNRITRILPAIRWLGQRGPPRGVGANFL